jgi:hypothetical protein
MQTQCGVFVEKYGFSCYQLFTYFHISSKQKQSHCNENLSDTEEINAEKYTIVPRYNISNFEGKNNFKNWSHRRRPDFTNATLLSNGANLSDVA